MPLRRISMPVGDQLLHDRDHRRDMVGGTRLDGRRQAAERRRVRAKDPDHVVGQRPDRNVSLGGPRVDLVVDVGDVADVNDVLGPIDVPQQPEQHVEDDQHAAVADVQEVVDRRPAGIEPHPARVDRRERLFPPCQGVVETQLHGREKGGATGVVKRTSFFPAAFWFEYADWLRFYIAGA